MSATKQALLEELDREDSLRTVTCDGCGDKHKPEDMAGSYCRECWEAIGDE